MSSYFRPFPIISYSFGSGEDPVIFQNISAYIDIIDQLKDDASYYQLMQIEEYERPDTLSQKLYGTTEYYWTFFLLNDDLKESGWPLSNVDLRAKAIRDYPNRVVTTTADISNILLPGETAVGVTSSSTGKILKKYHNLGQLVIASPNNFNVGELIRTTTDLITFVPVVSEVVQYNSVHHYENSQGEWVDINPFNPITTNLIPITYLDRMITKNDQLKSIKVLKREVAPQIATNFKKALAL
jgi:hypothetical protein